MMPLIANIKYQGIDLSHKHGVVVLVRGDAPPGAARSPSGSTRKRFWEQGKRLPMGGLVALLTKTQGHKATVSLALITTCTLSAYTDASTT